MGKTQSAEFTCIDTEGQQLSPDLIALDFPEFKKHITVLNTESKGLEKDKIFAYSSLKHYDYDSVLNYRRRDAIVFVCKKISEDKFQTFVYLCKNFSYTMDLAPLETILKDKSVDLEKITPLVRLLKSKDNFENVK